MGYGLDVYITHREKAVLYTVSTLSQFH